jgi:hypothetical protein
MLPFNEIRVTILPSSRFGVILVKAKERRCHADYASYHHAISVMENLLWYIDTKK